MDPLVFRAATEDDVDRLLDIALAAYPDDRGVIDRRRTLVSNPFGSLTDLVVVERGEAIVAKAFLYSLEAHFGGVAATIGAIASVAVAPEARGQGIATALMEHLHVASDMRSDALTMLHAFRHGYYARFGYAIASSRKRLAFDPRSVPDAWRTLAHRRVRGAHGNDRDAIKGAYARTAARASGWITRPPALWDRLFARERRFVLVADGERGLSGYVAFAILQDEAHAEAVLEVDELVSDDAETRRALLGALARMRDQVTEIVLEVDTDDPLEQALVDPDGRRFGTATVAHDLGRIVGGPMVRIEDVPRAIEARGYADDGSFDVVIRPSAADASDDLAVSVRVDGGRAEVGAARGGAVLRTTRAGLAALLYGGLPATRAVALGLADADPKTAARIDAIAAIAPLTSPDAF